LGFEKSLRSVTHDSLRYINILTSYLLTYLLLLLLLVVVVVVVVVHKRGPATRKIGPPMVTWRVAGTSNADVNAERI